MPKMLLGLVVLLPGQAASLDEPEDLLRLTAVVDDVVQDLRRFRAEKDRGERIAFIRRRGPIPDPRVLVALMEEVVLKEDAHKGELLLASWMVCRHQIPPGAKLAVGAKYWTVARMWWSENETDV